MDRRCPWPTWLSLTGPDPIRFDEHGAATQRNVSGALSSRVLCDPAHHCFHMRRGTVTWGLGGVYSAGRPIMGATVACVHVCMCVSSEPLLLVCMYVTHARDVTSHGTKHACTSPTPLFPLPVSPSSPSFSPMACHRAHASAGPVHPRKLHHTKSETALARPRGIRLHCVVCVKFMWYVSCVTACVRGTCDLQRPLV